MSPLIKNLLGAIGSVAEWSKALVLGTSHFDGVGSNPTAAKSVPFPSFKTEFLFKPLINWH